MEQIAAALNSHDAAALKAMFSTRARAGHREGSADGGERVGCGVPGQPVFQF